MISDSNLKAWSCSKTAKLSEYILLRGPGLSGSDSQSLLTIFRRSRRAKIGYTLPEGSSVNFIICNPQSGLGLDFKASSTFAVAGVMRSLWLMGE